MTFPGVVFPVRKTTEWTLSIDSVFHHCHPGPVRYGGQSTRTTSKDDSRQENVICGCGGSQALDTFLGGNPTAGDPRLDREFFQQTLRQ
jgi:hypothetical protein